MTALTAAEEAACPTAAREMLRRYVSGEASAEIMLMHLLLAAGAGPPLRECLKRLAATRRAAFVELAEIAVARADALTQTAQLIETGATELAGGDPIAAIRERFDRAVALAPEASVALYSLNDPATLDRATAELAALLERWELLAADRSVLDIGCGIGRIERALAPRIRHIIGIDVSPAMIAEATRRCADIANAAFAVCDGSGLSHLAESGFDLVLAVDSFPYLVAAGDDIAERHIRDAAGLLRPGGTLAVFNYSYRGDLALDCAEIATSAGAAGLDIVRNGTRDLALWDAASFVLRAPDRRG